MDYIYAELNDDIRDIYFTGYVPENSDEETVGVIVNIDNQTRKISADLSDAAKELLATHGDEIVRVEGKLDEEISRAEVAKAELSRLLTAEVNRAQAEETSLDRRLNGLKSETSLIAAELAHESEARVREDTVLTNRLTAEVQRAEAEESRIETTLRAALAAAESNLNNRITREELARVNADTNLNISIENVSTQLTNKIDGEASERALAIEGVMVQLTAESDTRIAEDNSIRALVQEEAATARGEESKLATQINNAVAGLQLEDAKIRASLSEELITRTEADNNLSASLSAEIADRKAADTTIIERLDTAEDDIDTLEGRATAAEGRLDTIEGADGLIAAGDATTLEAAKSYTDEREVEIKKYVDQAELDAISSANGYTDVEVGKDRSRLTAIEGAITNLQNTDTTIVGRLDVIQGVETVDGSIAKALKDAKDYADSLAGNYDEKGSAAQALVSAKAYADSSVVSEKSARENADSALSGRIDGISTRVSALEGDNGAIAIGDATTLESAEAYTDEKISDLENGQVKVNKEAIATLSGTATSEIERVEGLVIAEETRAKGVEADFEDRIAEIEVFFKEEKVDGALNTLYEIQDYIDTHDGAVETMISNINANTAKIGALETASATHAEKTYVDEELAKKVDVTTYNAKVAELTSNISNQAEALATETAAREEEDSKLYKYIVDNITSYRVFNQEDFNNLLTTENVGKTISYNDRVYLIKKQEKETGTKPGVAPEVGQQLSHLYFNTKATPDFSSYADETDTPAFALAFQQGVTIFPAYAEGKGSMLIGTNIPLYSSFVYPAGSYGDLGPGWIDWPETEVGSIIDGVWTLRGSGVTVSEVINPERFTDFISVVPFERAIEIEVIATPIGEVLSVNGHIGDVVLSKEDIGLGQVDNTPDSEKEVAYAERALKDATGNEIAATYATSAQLTQEVDALEATDTELNAAIGTKLATDAFNTWKDSHEADHAKTAAAITAEIAAAVSSEKALREAADASIDEKFGAAYSKDATVASAIADAKQASTDAVTAHNISAEAHADIRAAIPTKTSQLTNDSGFLTSVPELNYCEEITYAELKALRDNGELIPGMNYRITDYVTTTSQLDTQSAGHQFDIIVTALSANTLSETASVDYHSSENDPYFAGVKLEAWEVKYCFDNDKTRFIWADEENGKGIIYYMKDEWDNECPYDFKNILFKRSVTWFADHSDWCDNVLGYVPAEDKWFYTFTWVDESDTVQDLTLIGNSLLSATGDTIGVFRNKMGICSAGLGSNIENNVEALSYNILVSSYYYTDGAFSGCVSNTFGDHSYFNTFGNSCNFNTFGNNCSHNTFGNSCYFNTFGNYAYSNTFGNKCSRNTFSNECYSNTFGNSCYVNTFGNYCDSNTFGNDCHSNTFDNYCYSNTFGNFCDSNIFGNDCDFNTFGNSCYSNTFGSYGSSNAFSNGCSYNTLGNGCENNKVAEYSRGNIFELNVAFIELTSETQGNYENSLKNIKICLGISGSSTTNPLVLTVDRNLEYETKFVASGSKEVII